MIIFDRDHRGADLRRLRGCRHPGGQYLRERRSRRDAKEDSRSEADKWQEEAILTLLHDRLYAECTAAIQRESIDVDGLRNVEALYQVYHARGGNGTGTSLYKRATALPIRE